MSTGPLSLEGFDTSGCTLTARGDSAEGLGVDSFEVWRRLPDAPDEKLIDFGAPCASVPNEGACLGALDAARRSSWGGAISSACGSDSPGYERVVATKGDEAIVIESVERLVEFLRPVDTIAKVKVLMRYETYGVACEGVRRVDDGFQIIVKHSADAGTCSVSVQRHLLHVSGEGAIGAVMSGAPERIAGCPGRRPAGLAAQAVASSGAAARHLERQAYLEGASVEAFERIALELEAFGAPRDLVERALVARDDEVRHYALSVALGRRFDPDFACQAPEAAKAEPRSLYAFALENAVEGCVRETWGALVACRQAAHARDGAVRFVARQIAEDETRHAELAWAMHAWLLGRLGEGERRALDGAMVRALDELLGEVKAGDGLGEGELGLLGLPSPGEAFVLLGRLGDALFAKPRAA